MQRLITIVFERPVFWIAAVAVLTLALGFGLTRIELRTDGAAIYPRNSAVVDQTEADRITFHDPQQVILMVTSQPDGPVIVSPEGFRYVKFLHESLRNVPAVRSDGIRSLASLLDIQANLETMSVTSFLDSIPEEPAQFAALVERIRRHPLTDGLFLSADGQAAAFYIPLAENAQRQELLNEIEHWIAGRKGSGFDLRLTGPLVAEATLGEIVLRDLALLIPIMVAVVAVLLFLTLRTVGGVIIPMVEALLVLVWTLGLMGFVGAPITLVTTILPVILMTMAITDEIHLLQRVQSYLLEQRLSGHSSADNRQLLKQATTSALKDVGKPIIGTSLTTSVGFLSFLTASMSPMQHFGVFIAFGITLAMVLSFTFIPALIVMLPISWFQPRRVRDPKTATPTLRSWERLVSNHSRGGLIFGVVALVISVPGALRLTVQDSWVDNFDPSSELVRTEKDFNARFWGSYRFDVAFEGPQEIFFQPEGAKVLEQFTRLAQAGPHVGGVASYLVPFGEVARGLGLGSEVSALSEGQINDIALLAEMSTDPLNLLQLVSQDGGSARATVFVNSPDYQRSEKLKEYLEEEVASMSESPGITYHFSGDIPVALEVVDSIVTNQLRSVSWTLVGIFLLLLLTFARGRAGFIAMVPVTSAVLIILAGMGYAGVPLGIATSMFASLTIGVGVDFALHFLHNYKRERRGGLEHQPALLSAFSHTGQAIRWNAMVLALGFLVLTFSAIKPDRSLGILLSAAMIACYGTTLLFLPRLLRYVKIVLPLTCIAVFPASALAGEPAGPAEGRSAEAFMLQIEQDFRKLPRIVKMDFSTTYARRRDVRIDRAMWGICDGDTALTRILYVVTNPIRMRGTTLMFKDDQDPDKPDSAWLYLRAFKRLSRLTARSYRALIPGTALSYEDSRGFIPVEKYDFHFPDDSSPDTDSVVVVAVPESNELRQNLGFDSMVLRVDPKKRLITRIDYHDSNAKVFKIYEVLQSVELQGVWFPRRVQVAHITNGVYSTVDYTYWRLTEIPNDKLYRADISKSLFFDRLEQILKREGLDSLLTD